MRKQDMEIQQIAKSQHGVISRLQLQDLRVSRFQIKRRVHSGEWVRELPGVWRLSWAEPSWMQKVWCASLWGGTEALISHRAAARLWELDGIKFEGIELTSAHRLRTKLQWLSPHQTDALPREMRRMKNGVPLTSPARTLVDLAGAVDDRTLQRALEYALRRRMVSVPAIRRILRFVPERGRGGTGRLARLLEGGVGHAETQSELERQAFDLFRRFRLPKPACQYDVIAGDRRLAVVDFAWPRLKVIVEAEGFQFHSGREAWESDIARYNALVIHGWKVLRLTHADLQDRAEAFASSLAKAITARRPHHLPRQLAH
jgi:very-short-patch-repair endonuclease